MLERKITSQLEEYLSSSSNKMLLVNGARQIGKSFIIREIGKRMFKNFIEINMEEDRLNDRLFADARTVDSFLMALGAVAGEAVGDKSDTLVFIDEIQAYDHLLTLVKFLMEDDRYRYIASGSLLGVTLRNTQSVPVGSLTILDMFPLDFEEFLWANSFGKSALQDIKTKFERKESLPDAVHQKMMDLFKRYLLVGGMPDAVNTFLAEHNIAKVRNVQRDIMKLYVADASKYEKDAGKKLKIQRVYKMIPSYMGQTKKRIVFKEIEGLDGKRSSDYQEEFEYLVSSGIALEVDAISRPTYPLVQNAGKNLLKLYMNDVGLLTSTLYGNNIKPVMQNEKSVDLGSVYESVVAQELKAHGYSLYYCDNKKLGEVDFLIDNQQSMSALPLEVKSGKDYMVHKALDRFMKVPDYHVTEGIVFSNSPEVRVDSQGVTYMPIYYVMWLRQNLDVADSDLYI